MAAHTRHALRSLASRASRRFRTPHHSLARVIPLPLSNFVLFSEKIVQDDGR